MATQARVLITGNTYPVKDQIKAMGGRWDPVARGWTVVARKADEARALVAAAQIRAEKANSKVIEKSSINYVRRDPVDHGNCKSGRCGSCYACMMD